MNRRAFLFASLVAASPLAAQTADIWTAAQARAALQEGSILMLDIRTAEEWAETGVAEGALPVSLHQEGFAERLFKARELAQGRPVALICATGGRTDYVMQALRGAGQGGFVDVSEGMMGSALGRGWIASGLPVVTLDKALSILPEALR